MHQKQSFINKQKNKQTRFLCLIQGTKLGHAVSNKLQNPAIAPLLLISPNASHAFLELAANYINNREQLITSLTINYSV